MCLSLTIKNTTTSEFFGYLQIYVVKSGHSLQQEHGTQDEDHKNWGLTNLDPKNDNPKNHDLKNRYTKNCDIRNQDP